MPFSLLGVAPTFLNLSGLLLIITDCQHWEICFGLGAKFQFGKSLTQLSSVSETIDLDQGQGESEWGQSGLEIVLTNVNVYPSSTIWKQRSTLCVAP